MATNKTHELGIKIPLELVDHIVHERLLDCATYLRAEIKQLNRVKKRNEYFQNELDDDCADLAAIEKVIAYFSVGK